MSSLLKQKRKRVKKNIGENPATVTVIRKTLIDDGFGGQVTNPAGSESTHEVRVRVAHERRSAPGENLSPVGLSTQLGRMVLAEYDADINEDDIFYHESRYWRVGPVDVVMMFAGAIAKQAPLTEAEYYGNEDT